MIALVGPETIGIALIVGVIVFGASKLPQIARSVGQAKGEFQKGLKEGAPEEDPDAPKEKEPEAKKTSDGSTNGSGG
jgi:sec-independent protein translocase protein TatA